MSTSCYETFAQAIIEQAAHDKRSQPWKCSVKPKPAHSSDNEEWYEVAGGQANENSSSGGRVDVREHAFPMGEVDIRTNAFPMREVDVRTNAFPMGAVDVRTNAFPMGEHSVRTNAFPI